MVYVINGLSGRMASEMVMLYLPWFDLGLNLHAAGLVLFSGDVFSPSTESSVSRSGLSSYKVVITFN